jgi:hypothetical protein
VLDKYFDAVGRALPPGAKLRLNGVYQKSGSLRIDATPKGEVADDLRLALHKAAVIAESRSYRVCETCGKLGHLSQKHRRLFVACEAHVDGAEPLPPNERVVQSCQTTLMPLTSRRAPNGAAHVVAPAARAFREALGVGGIHAQSELRKRQALRHSELNLTPSEIDRTNREHL